ncbi:chaperonin 10-like protein [Plectosphaerella plurivora]|uniref:Chaperonin 10-like protein n=1 Tax=Plectosphaerella plurivora TaxID=936078 RepID=A0A9P9ACU4_9PEZI|nr:chaperonin 10-like protein [Plectosphaerella plurivora]
MSTMKALVANHHILARVGSLATGKSFGGSGVEVADIPKPTISPKQLLVKIHEVALNPTDYKHIDVLSPPGSIIGCDYAGEVVQVGSGVPSGWSVGDRVAGVVHGGLYPDRGAFAEFAKVDAELAWKIPEGVSDTDATTFGVSAITAMQALCLRHGLVFPGEAPPALPAGQEKPVVFIYAGSTSAGLFTTQVAKLAGCTVVVTASPHSFDVVKSYGADAAFNYRDPNVVADIVKQYPNVSLAVDCFSEGQSFGICDGVLKNAGGKLIALLQPPKPKYSNVTHDFILAYTLIGDAFEWLPPIGPKFAAIPEDRKGLVRFYGDLPELVRNKVLRPLPTYPEEARGFDGIMAGLDKLRSGKGPAGKIVVRM